jgi:ubiquinone/menaquinone biosynthesis C-methylase UbiE
MKYVSTRSANSFALRNDQAGPLAMQRIDAPEILDSDGCSPQEVQAALKTIGRINRWFGGVATTRKMLGRVAQATGIKRFSMLEVAAGRGEVPAILRNKMARDGVAFDVTLLDMARSHLPPGSHSVVADALRIPFSDSSFDLVGCNLFVHHLNPQQLTQFIREGMRVCRQALVLNDLVRDRLHLGLVYASFPIMGSRVAWVDGITSVRRAYVPQEIRDSVRSAFPYSMERQVEIYRHFLFRMAVIVWKKAPQE